MTTAKRIVFAALMVAASFTASSAQDGGTAIPKIAYTNADAILAALPEAKTIESELKTYEKQLSDQMKAKQGEYQKKVQDLQANAASMIPAVLEDKKQELATLEQSIYKFEQDAQQSLQQKQSSLLQPVYEKIQNGINKVAKEKGFTYVFSSEASGFPILLYAAEEFNITNLIIKELGGTVPAPATGTTGATGK